MKTLFIVILITNTFFQNLYSQISENEIKYGQNEKAGHYVPVRGFNMYYETYGTGQPLLFIHGNGGAIINFQYQIPYYSKEYKVFAPDSRAHGKSIDFGDSLSYKMMADDLNALLDTLAIDSCNVVGWSDGGIIGLLLAIHYPDKVKKLAITGANLWPDTSAVDPAIYNWAIDEHKQIEKLATIPRIKNTLKIFRLVFAQTGIELNQLSSIKCPTLVIAGDHDVIRSKHTLLIAESIPKSYLWILPDSGHSIPIFYTELFNHTVNDFFKKPYRDISGTKRFN